MYEITFITKDEKNSLIKNALKEIGAKILSDEFLGRKKFSYKIAKENAGYYTTIVFEADTQDIEKLVKKISHEQEITRYLIVKKDKIAPKQQMPIKTQVKPEKPIIIKKIEAKPEQTKIKEKPVKEKKVIQPKVKKTPKVEIPSMEVMPKAKIEKAEKEVSDEERLKKLDEKLSELLKE